MSLLGLVCGFMYCSPPATFGLSTDRGYEMVSPAYKDGFGVLSIQAVSQDGEKVGFYSPGNFAGIPSGAGGLDYMAHREASGWVTSPEVAPALLSPYVVFRDISPALDLIANLGKSGTNSELAFESPEEEFSLHPTASLDLSANWEVAGFPLKTLEEAPIGLIYEGASPNFCHFFLSSAGAFVGQPALEALVPEALKAERQVYDFDTGCDGREPSIQLVALNSSHQPISPSCKVDIGLQDYGARESAYNAIAAQGEEVFFTTCVNKNSEHHQLFVRLGGTTTLEVSKPLAEVETCVVVAACKEATTRPPAEFIGASEDGSKVFFTTAAQLVGEDHDTSNDLYMANIGCPESEPTCSVAERVVTALSKVSQAVNAEPAEVQGVVRVAPDGSHVYFVARGILSSGANAEGSEPIKGADNLYVYDSSSSETRFIGDLCSGFEVSGVLSVSRCPSKTGNDLGLWRVGPAEAQTSGSDGRFLVFASYSQLTTNDTDTAKDIYRYDSQTGAIVRISDGESGYDANGNNDGFDATISDGHEGQNVAFQYELGNRAMSENGSAIVFRSAEPLSPAATNNFANVYLWQETTDGQGEVSLVSSGSAEGPDEQAVVSANGQDVFFVTVQRLLPGDTDSAPDIYDARVNGGFFTPEAPLEECSSDGCQGPLTNPAPLLIPGSSLQTAGENVAPSKSPAINTKKKTKKTSRKKTRQRKISPHAKRSRRDSEKKVLKNQTRGFSLPDEKAASTRGRT